ncbi:ABC transporter permease [Nocardiopsis sp. CC223A]|uniref:ABC transporter permease n=1 Tax=Nocardiopsis sp. CC223A TaxID=3044051 RepID=UPI00278C106C|nr:ABC transporter permease [Nocardiopsis sp. CC223A]
MNPVPKTVPNAVRAGFSRGWIEFKNSFTSPGEVIGGYLAMPLVFIVLTLFVGDDTVDGSGTPVAAMVMTGGVSVLLLMLGTATVAQVIGSEREDGTLLRARVAPAGMVGYAVGKTWHLVTMSAAALALMLAPGLVLIDGFAVQGPTGAFTLVWVTVLSLTALAPIGAVLGATLSNPRTGVGLIMIPVIGLTMVSGIMSPISVMPPWLQTVAQVFPVYWSGMGVRAALLPEAHAAAELAGTWQLPQVAGVLALWAVVGFVAAQWVLRRMTRRTSGSRVQAAREKAMQRAY